MSNLTESQQADADKIEARLRGQLRWMKASHVSVLGAAQGLCTEGGIIRLTIREVAEQAVRALDEEALRDGKDEQ